MSTANNVAHLVGDHLYWLMCEEDEDTDSDDDYYDSATIWIDEE